MFGENKSSMVEGDTALCLKALVHRYLSSNLLDVARFYAERLYYENPVADNLYLLALCYFRNGKAKQAYLILQNSLNSSLCKYLFALACDKLGKLEEGERALRLGWSKGNDVPHFDAIKNTPGGAEGVYLLGRFCRRQHRKEMAIAYYKYSLKLDPYLWSSIVELSDLGIAINMKELLGTSESSNKAAPHGLSEEKENWLNEVRQSTTDRYYSTGNVFQDHRGVDQYKVAELLGDGVGGRGVHASPRVSMALGMSSMSLHVPFASPGDMPSPLMGYTNGSIIGGDISGFHGNTSDSRGMRSVSLHSSETSYPPRGGETGNSDFDRGHLQATRTALFGMGTPGLTPVASDHNGQNKRNYPVSTAGMQGTMRGALMNSCDTDGSTMKGIDLFGGSAPNSHAVTAGNRDRRVSFGPTARLSFSGDLDGGASVALHSTAIQSFDEEGVSRGTDAGAGHHIEDDYPFKQPRADPDTASPTAGTHRTSEASNRALPRKLNLSPFPVESSPIVHSNLNESILDDAMEQGTDSPSYRKKLGQRNSLGVPFCEGTSRNNNKENGDHYDDGDGIGGGTRTAGGTSAGIAGVDETFGQGSTAHASQSGGAQSDSVAAVDGLHQLIVTFARAYQMLCTYCCRACIQELQDQLPEHHFRSALVSQWIGKAYYEMNEYKPAMLAFREMLRVEPFRLCGLETLSTALWHLKSDKELSALAQQVVEVDKTAPESWCVVGNCFSLQKEPDAAIRFFQRALQLDPSFTYAYTLCGHEQVNNEDLEKAIDSFRLAILYNSRHYNAWYGLGSIYFRQEKYELAEYHFRTALEINPASSVLHCYLGMALHAQGTMAKTTEALDVLTQASQRDVDNPQLHFQRASILVAVDNLPEALSELLIVEEHAPKEPPVHALLGQVYHRMGELQLAIRHLNIAMDLDPKESGLLKGILEHIDDPPMEN